MPKPAPSSLVLETDRVSLRHFHLTDAASFARVFDDAYAQRFYPDMTDEAAARRWIAKNLERYTTDGFGFWALCLRSTGELIGDCGLTNQAVEQTTEVEVGYHLRADYRGQGIITEAAAADLSSRCATHTRHPEFETAHSVGTGSLHPSHPCLGTRPHVCDSLREIVR